MTKPLRSSRMDAPTTAFFARQLEHIEEQTYDVVFDELKGRSLVPLNTSIDPGAEEYTYNFYEAVGKAALITDYGMELPRADVIAGSATSKIYGLGASYGWSIQEIRAAMMAKVDLEGRKAAAARESIERGIDDLLTIGNSTRGIYGLFSLPISGANAVAVATLAAGVGGDTWDDANKTPDEILADLHSASNYVHTNSRGNESASHLVLPLTAHSYIATKKMGDGDSSTILKAFLDNDQHVKEVTWHNGLETAGAGSTRRAVFYRKDPNKIEALLPQDFEQLPPQQRSLQMLVACHARCGGVIARYPKSVCYLDGF